MKGAGSEGYLLSKSYSYYIFTLLFFAGSFSYKKDLGKVEKIALECED